MWHPGELLDDPGDERAMAGGRVEVVVLRLGQPGAQIDASVGKVTVGRQADDVCRRDELGPVVGRRHRGRCCG
jgi:hypothetical protein